MGRTSYEWRMADLRCNNCGYEFSARVLHSAPIADETGEPMGWLIESISGVTCPSCDARTVGPRD